MIRLALLLTLAFTVTASAQNYSVPRKLPLESAAKREFPEYLRNQARYPGLIPEQFFPIGWSRDGKFAFYHEPVDEACGCYFANLVIQDMKTDKVLWEFKYRQDELADTTTGDMPPEDDIRKLWRKNAKLFSDKLREYAIEAGPAVMLGKTFSSDGRSFTVRAVAKKGINPEYGDERVNKLTFTITSAKLGTKTLTTVDNTKEAYPYMLDAAVLGVIRSPFEPRVAVIGMDVNRGWEGPPHTGDIRIVGASLRF